MCSIDIGSWVSTCTCIVLAVKTEEPRIPKWVLQVCVYCRQGALELERLRETRRAEEEAWLRQQQLLLEAEEQRRKTLALEEDRLTDQRARSEPQSQAFGGRGGGRGGGGGGEATCCMIWKCVCLVPVAV